MYDRTGKQVGILVRASYEYDGKQYIRSVRMTFVVASIKSAYEALSDSEKAAVYPYLGSLAPSPIPNTGDTPGFPVESLLAGLTFVTLVVILNRWFRRRTS